jgi:hypothetical protein
MKREQKKLKLTKLTVVNLQRVKGGRPDCACEWTVGNGQWNHDHWTAVKTFCAVPIP